MPPSALAVPGAAERVIYAGTFTKPFATGARVGYGILPEPLFTAVKHIKGNHDFGTANLLQQLFARALASGAYERHVARLQKRYAHKARVMKLAIEKHFPPSVEWWEPEGGLYFWARLPKNVSTGVKSKVFQTALKNDVLYVPGEICYADDPARQKPDHEMRISFGSASEEKSAKASSGWARCCGNLFDRSRSKAHVAKSLGTLVSKLMICSSAILVHLR